MIKLFGHKTVIAGRDQWLFAEFRSNLDTHTGTIATLEALPREPGEKNYHEVIADNSKLESENQQLKERIANLEGAK